MVTSWAPDDLNLTKRICSVGAEAILSSGSSIDINTPGRITGRFDRHNHSQEDTSSGEIWLVDYMGADAMPGRVASSGFGPEIYAENPELPDFLRHIYASGVDEAFESIQLKLGFTAPIQVAEFFVPQANVSVNELSGRYSRLDHGVYIPDMGYIQKRLSGRAQEERAQKILKLLESSAKGSRTAYEELLETGFTRELARAPLGGDTITKWYWSVTLLDLAGIVDQGRRKFPTQDYRRDWIEAVAGVAEKVAPYAWQTLMQRPTKKLSLSLTKNPFDFEAEANGPSWDPSQTRRPSSPLEDILFKPLRHPLLVGGWVQAIDYMGNQLSPAQAARVSYGSGTNQRSRDLRLLRTLVRDKHTTPLEMLRVGMEVREPKFVSRQIVRHRTLPWCAFMGDLSPEAGPYIPPTDRLSYQSGQEKQGSSGQLPEESQRNVLAVLNSIFDSQAEIVKGLTDLGAPGEIIDRVPGVGHYNRVWRSGDAHNLANFFRLRLDSHAQAEAQAIASILANVAKNHFPKIYQAMENFGWEGISLSQAEIQLLKDSGIIDPHVALPRGLLQYNEIFSVDSRGNPTREVKGLAGKLRRLGIINPLGNLTT